MLAEKTVTPPRRWSIAAVVIGLLLLIIGAAPVMRAQESPTTPPDPQIRRKAELHTREKGKVIAEGMNANASAQVPVNRYTVEELKLDEPLEVEVGGKKTEVYQAYRITVFGGPFAVRAMALMLAIDDKITLVGMEGRQVDRVTFVLYDRSLLREGAKFTVGYGAGNIELTDKLSLGEKRK
jgi:hypothetical protein